MKKTFLGLGAVCLFLAACGGGGGVSDSAVLGELSDEDAQSLCEEVAGERTVDCDGTEVTFGIDPAECVDAEPPPATCEATAGDLRDCYGAMDALSDEEICNLTELPSECDFLSTAECGGGGA